MKIEKETPRRYQRSRGKGARLPAGVVCVDRSTQWGNPFAVEPVKRKLIAVFEEEIAEFWRGVDRIRAARVVKHAGLYRDAERAARALCIERYRARLEDSEDEQRAIAELRGKSIACWCGLCEVHRETGKPLGTVCDACELCHADVLLEFANGMGVLRG